MRLLPLAVMGLVGCGAIEQPTPRPTRQEVLDVMEAEQHLIDQAFEDVAAEMERNTAEYHPTYGPWENVGDCQDQAEEDVFNCVLDCGTGSTSWESECRQECYYGHAKHWYDCYYWSPVPVFPAPP